MSDTGKGMATAVSVALAEGAEELGEGEQLDLLREAETEQGQAKIVHVRRGPGRPAGSRNKRTERTIAWLMARHRDPREVLLSITDMHPADLAALLACTLHEALQEIRLAAAAVLPYVAQKQPLAIDVTGRQVVHLHIDTGSIEPGQGGGVGLTARVVDAVQYQEVSDDDAPQV